MSTTPTSLSLTPIADNSQIIASTHRNNNSAIQTAVNALISFLSGGTSGQVVTSGGGTTINWASVGGLYRKSTAKTVSNSVAETDLLNAEITVAGNALGTTGALRLTAWGDWKQNSGGATDYPRLKLKLGATTVIDTGVTATSNAPNLATRFPWRVCAEIMNLGAANSQWAHLSGKLLTSDGAAATAAVAVTTGEGYILETRNQGIEWAAGNSSAVDTTTAQTLVLSVILPSASASLDMVLKGAVVEVI